MLRRLIGGSPVLPGVARSDRSRHRPACACGRPPRSPRPRVLARLCVCTWAPAAMSHDAVPMGLPYFTTASPAAMGRERDLVSAWNRLHDRDDGLAGSNRLARVERLEGGGHVIARADDECQAHWLTPLASRPPSTISN